MTQKGEEMNWNDFWTALLAFLGGGALAAVLAYLQGRRKDATKQENNLIARQEKRILYLEQKLQSFTDENARLREEVGALREAVNRLEGIRVSAIIVADMNGKITDWNPAATSLLHWSQEEAVGKDISILIPPGLRGKHSQAFFQAISGQAGTENPPPMETSALTKDGRVIPVTIEIRCWVTQGNRFFSAEIRRR
jgi:PAS domain S-box-containing protein